MHCSAVANSLMRLGGQNPFAVIGARETFSLHYCDLSVDHAYCHWSNLFGPFVISTTGNMTEIRTKVPPNESLMRHCCSVLVA